jgi:hypothetical protein
MNDNEFFAWIMFDNHTFRKTDCGTVEQVHAVVKATSLGEYPAEDRDFALFSLHHADLKEKNEPHDHTKLYTGRDPEVILDRKSWHKHFNPFTD